MKPKVPVPQIKEISEEAGVKRNLWARGTILEDFDGDGYLDLMVGGFYTPLLYFHNNGDGTFSDWTHKIESSNELTHVFCLVAGDFDNNGHLDVYVTRCGWGGKGKNALLRNNGDGSFTDVTDEAGVGDMGSSFGAAVADFDNDGNLDIYVCNLSVPMALPFGLNRRITLLAERGRDPNVLYRNNGDGTFTNVTNQAGVELTGLNIGCAWGDYNQDGFPDLYVSTFFDHNRLFHNNGDGTFTDIARDLKVEQPYMSFNCWFWDYDNDGKLDLMTTVWNLTRDCIPSIMRGKARREELAQHLYRNNGDGTFTDVTVEAGLNHSWNTMYANFGDLNNTGYLDFYLGNGGPSMLDLVPNAMYLNNGDGTFSNVAFQTGTAHIRKGHGTAFGDINNDGYLDLWSPLGGPWPGDYWNPCLYLNQSKGNNWLAVRVEGVKTNRAGIGAKIKLKAGDLNQYREVGAGSSLGSNSLRQHFGLGKAENVDRLEISWPVSQSKQVFENIPANQLICVKELETSYTPGGRQ